MDKYNGIDPSGQIATGVYLSDIMPALPVFVETGANTGAFNAHLMFVNKGKLDDSQWQGMKLTFTYVDLFGDQTSRTLTFSGKTASITSNLSYVKSGDSLSFTIKDDDLNLDDSKADKFTSSASSQAGYLVLIQPIDDDLSGSVSKVFLETGVNTGTFVATFAIGTDIPISQSVNGTLLKASYIDFKYNDEVNSTGSAGDEITILLPVEDNSPSTTILSSTDGYSKTIVQNGKTSSQIITFSYIGTANRPGVSMTGYQTSLDGAPFTATSATSITYSSLTIGTHTFRVRAVDSSGSVDPTPATFTWQITKITANLKVNYISRVPWSKSITVSGSLFNIANNAPLGDKTITFDGTGASGLPSSVQTFLNGTFKVTGASPASVATGWKVQAHFAGDSSISPANSNIVSYSTLKHSVSLTLSSSNKPWGKATTFTVYLKDASMSYVAISGKTIHFNGTYATSVADAITDSTGKAVGVGTAPSTVASGWTAQGHFSGDSLYYAKDSSIKTYSTTKHSTSLTLTLSPSTVIHGGAYSSIATLKDSTLGVVLASRTINFTATSPIVISSQITDSTGVAKASGLIAPDLAGSYNIQAHYAGEALYYAKDSSIKILTVT